MDTERNAYTMKDLPPETRPYERMWEKGSSVLSDTELVAVLLRSGRVGETALQMSERLLHLAGSDESTALRSLFMLSPQELSRFEGIGKVKALQLSAVGELSRRISAGRIPASTSLDSPSVIADHFRARLGSSEQEQVWGIWLDTRMHFLGETQLSLGSVNQALMSPRNIFLEALRFRAVCFVLVHNHPSGNSEASGADLSATLRIRDLGAMLEIRLVDHIIVTGASYSSMKEEGLL